MGQDTLEQRANLNVPVSFQAVGVNRDHAKVSVKLDREHIGLSTIDGYLTKSRCDVLIEVDPANNGDAKGQGKLIETAEAQLQSVADINRLSVGGTDVGFTLQFNRESIDLDDLSKFAYAHGRLVAVRIGDAGADVEEEDGEEGDDE